jgi:hypothetical protein
VDLDGKQDGVVKLQGSFWTKVGLNLDKRWDVVRGWLLVCCIKIMHAKTTLTHIYWVSVGFSAGAILGKSMVGFG